MPYDNDRLNDAVKRYMKNLGYSPAPLRFNGDSVWKCPDQKIIFIEHKTENESYNPTSWWNNYSDNLDGQRPIIKEHYRDSDIKIRHQNKWMLAIAQLRADIKNVENPQAPYRAAVVLPEVEISNFALGLKAYHMDNRLNISRNETNISINIWSDRFSYVDQRNVRIWVCLAELNVDNYFGSFR